MPLLRILTFALAATTAVGTVLRCQQDTGTPAEPALALVAGGFAFVEGPAWDAEAGALLFSDIHNDRIVRLGPDGEVDVWREPSGRSNGLAFDAHGRLYACLGGERALVRIDRDGATTVLASTFGGRRLNSPNDLALDGAGGVWFTDPRYGDASDVEQDVMGVYYVAADGRVSRVIDGLKRPNGILVSNDGATLFVAEPNRREIHAYPITAPGEVGEGRVWFRADLERDGRGPDGMAFDEAGVLYATYANVLGIDPAGRVVRRMPIPEHPTNCTFGGADGKTLYVTARTGLYSARMPVRGARLPGARPALHVVFTMDCERIRALCPPGGPRDWDLSARAIRGFCERLLAAGFPPTLFAVPENAVQHAGLLRELAGRGVEIGMHLHPQCFGDGELDKYLSQYGEAEQERLLRAGRAMITKAVGRAPVAFRPGNFSADEATLRVLVRLGFTHGSVSDPGRRSPRLGAVWVGAHPDVHWASDADRLTPGALPFLEFPVTTDPEAPRNRSGFPQELRIESGGFEEWHRPILERALARMERDGVAFRAIVVFTHNYWDYGDAGEPRTRCLADMLDALAALRGRYDVVGATIGELRERYLARFGVAVTPATKGDR